MLLTEYVRHRLARTISNRYRDRQGRMYVVTLDPAIEDRIRAGLEHGDRGLFVRMSPQAIEATCRVISAEVEKLTVANHPPVILVSPQIRAGLKQLTSRPTAAAGGAELQRSDPRHADRIVGTGERRRQRGRGPCTNQSSASKPEQADFRRWN